ncbi:hypothetical protein R6Z07F_007995 [Ovis aries]
MRNAGLDEAQAGIKIAGRNINNLRFADDTTLMAESEEELKSLLMKVKEGFPGGVRRRQWHPTPALLPGKSHGWRSLDVNFLPREPTFLCKGPLPGSFPALAQIYQ